MNRYLLLGLFVIISIIVSAVGIGIIFFEDDEVSEDENIATINEIEESVESFLNVESEGEISEDFLTESVKKVDPGFFTFEIPESMGYRLEGNGFVMIDFIGNNPFFKINVIASEELTDELCNEFVESRYSDVDLDNAVIETTQVNDFTACHIESYGGNFLTEGYLIDQGDEDWMAWITLSTFGINGEEYKDIVDQIAESIVIK